VAGCREVSHEEGPIIAQDFADVLPSLIDWWKCAVPVHDVLSRVIGSQREWKVPAKSVE
jgi:hypothetical protein